MHGNLINPLFIHSLNPTKHHQPQTALLRRLPLPNLNLLIQHEKIPILHHLIIHNQHGKKLRDLPALLRHRIVAPLVMAPRPLIPELAGTIRLRGLAIHLVDRRPSVRERDGHGAPVAVRGRAAVGWDRDVAYEQGFTGEVGGVVCLQDFYFFAGFAVWFV